MALLTESVDRWHLIHLSPSFTDLQGQPIAPPKGAFADTAHQLFRGNPERAALLVWKPNGNEVFSVEADGRVIHNGEVIVQL